MSDNPLTVGLDAVASPSGVDGPPPLLMSTADIARELRCSPKTVARMDATGKLPRPITIGYRAKRWPREELVRWIAAGAPGRAQWERLRGQPSVGRRSN